MSNVNMVAIERAAAKRERLAQEMEGGGDAAPNPKPLRKAKEKWYLVRGTETGVVVAKALLLLALLWTLGATRYLPAWLA